MIRELEDKLVDFFKSKVQDNFPAYVSNYYSELFSIGNEVFSFPAILVNIKSGSVAPDTSEHFVDIICIDLTEGKGAEKKKNVEKLMDWVIDQVNQEFISPDNDFYIHDAVSYDFLMLGSEENPFIVGVITLKIKVN